MVSQLLELDANDVTMRLRTDEAGWCQVELVIGGHIEILGADTEEVVRKRLASGLHDELTGSPSGEIQGVPVRWVLSFSEKHYTIYAADVGGNRVIFFQAPDGNVFRRVTLEPKQRQRCLSILQVL